MFNHSGEEYENAQIRLIVGKINLVERIADLARRAGGRMPNARDETYGRYKRRAYQRVVTNGEWANGKEGKKANAKQVVKEGLSEYFLFSVEGTETIKNGWSKRMIAVKADNTEFDILYRMRSHQYGSRPVRFFIWENDKKHKLGDSPLPNGLVRLFRKNGKDGLSYLGQQLFRYVPIKAKIEINLGTDDLVVYESKKMSIKYFNVHFRKNANKWDKNFGKEHVDGWHTEEKWVDTIKNYRTKPIKFELRRIWYGDVELNTKMPTKLFDYRTAEATFDIKARSKQEYPVIVWYRHGTNVRQSRIKLKHDWPQP